MGSICSFLFSLVIFFGFLVISDVVYNSRNHDCTHTRVRVCLVFSQCIGAVLYYVGNNTVYIARVYGEELHCGSNCRTMWMVVAMISLGSSLAYFHLVPSCLRHIAKQCQYEDKHLHLFSSSAMAAIFIKIDALLNTVNLAVEEAGSRCDVFTLILTTVFILVCSVIGIGLMAAYFSCSMVALKRNYSSVPSKMAQLLLVSCFVVLLVSFPTYLLIDNQQPLDCAFGCGLEAFASANSTTASDPSGCNSTGKSALRLILSIVIFIKIIFVSFLLFHFNRRQTAINLEPQGGTS